MTRGALIEEADAPPAAADPWCAEDIDEIDISDTQVDCHVSAGSSQRVADEVPGADDTGA